MIKENHKKRGLDPSVIALILLLTVSSIAINLYVFKDVLFGNSLRDDIIETLVRGDNANPFTNLTYNELLSALPGKVPVLMYHMFLTPWVETNYVSRKLLIVNRWTRRYMTGPGEFRDQLETLYRNGFRPISLDEYLSLARGEKKDLDRLPPGSKPFVLTFDDAGFGQFDITGAGPNGEPLVDPDCAVGVLLDFARRRPDFKLNAAFSICFSGIPFQQAEYVGKKLNMLLDYGFEIVNHTRHHKRLSRYLPGNPETVIREIAEAMELFESHLGYRALAINKICYPEGGENPDVWALVSNIVYKGRQYVFVAALDAEGLQAENPNEDGFNPYDISRIEISGDAFRNFVLNAPGLYRMPAMMEIRTNSRVAYRKDWKKD